MIKKIVLCMALIVWGYEANALKFHNTATQRVIIRVDYLTKHYEDDLEPGQTGSFYPKEILEAIKAEKKSQELLFTVRPYNSDVGAGQKCTTITVDPTKNPTIDIAGLLPLSMTITVSEENGSLKCN